MSVNSDPEAGATPPAPEATSRLPFGTVLGVDVGRRNLLAFAPADAGGSIERGHRVADPALEEEYTRLCERHQGDPDGVRDDDRADRLVARLDAAVADALRYADSFEGVVLVLEDLSYPDRSLADCVSSGAEPPCWLFPAVTARLVDRARRVGVPVVLVDPELSTKQCHRCQDLLVVRSETVTCTTAGCPVDEVDRDLSAAATLATRLF